MLATATLKAQMDMHTRWFNNVLSGISEEESHIRLSGLNHLKWVAGHTLNTRLTSVSRLVGLSVDDSYKLQFARGAAIDDGAVYPSMEEIVARWNTVSAGISSNIPQLSAELLGAKSGLQIPIADDTIGGAFAFLISHEAFHIGQMSVIRKMIGKEAMAY